MSDDQARHGIEKSQISSSVLTHVLSTLVQVSGIEGNFRKTCELVMSVLRESRDSLVAMLEAFVHDPLISWRILGTQGRQEGPPTPPSNANAPPPPVPTTGGGGGGADAPRNLERIPVPHRVSSPVRIDTLAADQQFAANAPQAGRPPPTPRLGPVNPGQRVNGPHDGRLAPPQAAFGNDMLPTPYGGNGNFGPGGNAGAGAGDAGWNGAAAAAAAAATAAAGAVVASGRQGEGTRYAEGNRFPGRLGTEGGGAAPLPVVGHRGSSVPRTLMLAGMTPLQPVPEFGRGRRESDAESDATVEDPGEPAEEGGTATAVAAAAAAAHEQGLEPGVDTEGGRATDMRSDVGGGDVEPSVPSNTRAGGDPQTTGDAAPAEGAVGGRRLAPSGFIETLDGDPRLDVTEGVIGDDPEEEPSVNASDGAEDDAEAADHATVGGGDSEHAASARSSRRPTPSVAVNVGRPRSASLLINGEGKGDAAGAGDGDGGGGAGEDEDEDEEELALAAAAAAAQAGSMAQGNRRRSNSLLQQSSSFRPHMHLQIQALSNRRNGSLSLRCVLCSGVRMRALACCLRYRRPARVSMAVAGLRARAGECFCHVDACALTFSRKGPCVA